MVCTPTKSQSNINRKLTKTHPGPDCTHKKEQTLEKPESVLGNLIPLAVVIAAGCAPCAKMAVWHALRQGVEPALIDETLGIITSMQTQFCLIQFVGREKVACLKSALTAARESFKDASLEK